MYQKELEQYIKSIDGKLSCPKQELQVLHNQIQNMCEEYLLDHPSASFDELVNFLGSPESIANNFQDSLDSETTEKYTKKKKRIYTILLIIFLTVFIAAFALFIFMSINVVTPSTVEYELIEGKPFYNDEEVIP